MIHQKNDDSSKKLFVAISMKVLNDRDVSKMILRNRPAFDVVVQILVRCLFFYQRLAF